MRQQSSRRALFALLLAGATLAHGAAPAAPAASAMLRQLEQAYADFNDAYGAVSLIDSDTERYWISLQLLRTGEEQETAQLLRRFLGRPVSPRALLDQVRRIAGPAAALSAARSPGPH
jgi:hypothetical protein